MSSPHSQARVQSGCQQGKRAAKSGRCLSRCGRASLVLLTFDDYKKITGGNEDRRLTGHADSEEIELRLHSCATQPTGGSLVIYLLDTK